MPEGQELLQVFFAIRDQRRICFGDGAGQAPTLPEKGQECNRGQLDQENSELARSPRQFFEFICRNSAR
jgi:hypothetical protein